MKKSSVEEIYNFLKNEKNTTFISKNIIYQVKHDAKHKLIIIPHIYIDDEGWESYCVIKTNYVHFNLTKDAIIIKDFDSVILSKNDNLKTFYTDQVDFYSFKSILHNTLRNNNIEYLLACFKNGINRKEDWKQKDYEHKCKTINRLCNLYPSIYRLTICYSKKGITEINQRERVKKIKEVMLDRNRYKIKEMQLII